MAAWYRNLASSSVGLEGKLRGCMGPCDVREESPARAPGFPVLNISVLASLLVFVFCSVFASAIFTTYKSLIWACSHKISPQFSFLR